MGFILASKLLNPAAELGESFGARLKFSCIPSVPGRSILTVVSSWRPFFYFFLVVGGFLESPGALLVVCWWSPGLIYLQVVWCWSPGGFVVVVVVVVFPGFLRCFEGFIPFLRF